VNCTRIQGNEVTGLGNVGGKDNKGGREEGRKEGNEEMR
jgi:hypothetical protein